MKMLHLLAMYLERFLFVTVFTVFVLRSSAKGCGGNAETAGSQ